MDMRRGFKRTEVGAIPIEWATEPFDHILRRLSAKEYQIATSEYQKSGRLPVIDQGKDAVVAFTDRIEKRFSCPEGGVIVFGDHTRAVKFVDFDFVVGAEGTQLLVAKDGANTRYLAYQLQFKEIPNAGYNRHFKFLKERIFAFPLDAAEQKAIAEALSEVDSLIESLEQLIAKKRDIKQGAMQELLTRKRRLPGFGGEWEVKRLDELGLWTGGMTPSMRNPDYWQSGTVPWISSGDVKSVRLTATGFAISDYAVKQRAATLIPAKSLVLVTRSGILRKYLPVAMNMIPMTINQDIKALLPNGFVFPEYLLQSLICNGDRILARCLKSGTTVESIEFSWLKAFTISIPALAEQTAIATILSDMDGEIAALEEELTKASNLKQGVMHELLTGRICLV